MKITDIRTHVMGVPGPDQRTVRRNWVFVEVRTDAGLVGVGEATTEYHELAVAAQIQSELRPRLLGLDPTDIERIWQMGYRDFWWRRGVVQTSALSGIDQALWDLAGKAAGLPVYKLLGGKVRERVRLYARPDFAAGTAAAAAAQAVSEGFTAFKAGQDQIPVPFDPLALAELEIASFAQIRAAVGPGVDLMIDCGGLFTPQAAHRLIAGLESVGMLFVEEPLEQGQIDPYVQLKRDFPALAIAAGERWMTRWDCRPWFERQAVDVCQVDVSHTGGISELMRIAALAELYGIRMAPHNPYGPVALAAAAHAAAAMPNFLVLEHCRLRPWFAQVQREPLPIRASCIQVADLEARPGLGVELDWELIDSHPHQPLAGRVPRTADGGRPLC